MKIIRPKKALGQHFLKDAGIARRIAETLSAYRGLPVLEVGAGTGMLTRFLLEEAHDLSVVEIDTESVEHLRRHFPALEGRIIAADFLRLDLHTLYPSTCCITGNYPYHISSQILFKVLDAREQVVCCTGMVQKEVAERLAASPPAGRRTCGIIGALIQPWYDVEYLFTVDEEAFDPPPKVKSAVIRMTRNDRKTLGCDETLYRQVVKTSFNRRRKMLRNSMRPVLGTEFPGYDMPVFDKRPEQLSVEQFVELTLIAEDFLEKEKRQAEKTPDSHD
ncbi:MAG: 16S rRNA (adenine(1518)-N(6)/adenine(1519)-N(6))-dimethyltransferase RsmA [Tannerella sp.]|jgi:16S rRNA (adenine1518-N6/adenine1519-N6)-dimethyltransferase|nr:16S rRNA (adenine(1518)-N(6)/adenine(1519)-N(6))-dimethyltransferase RsmA [Tannerella sp.]